MRFLNSKERKQFFEELKKTYGYQGPDNHIIYEGGKNKYYLLSKDIEKIPFEQIKIRHAGLYIAAKHKNGYRLSFDGAQILGAYCNNKLKVSYEELKKWLRGEEIPTTHKDGFIIIQYKEDIVGCGLIKEGWVKNYVPKQRRLNELH